jgi:stearoyl-CoA desaturase (delta-9 desaturase)
MFAHNHYQKILWISHLLVALISVDLWMYTMLLPAFITLHSFAIQTSLNHSKDYGYVNYERDEDSKNVVWLFPLILGEAWHNNHHGDAKNPNYGHRRWFELDPTYYLIKLISKKH